MAGLYAADGSYNVTIKGTTPGTGATDLGKAEDAQHTSGDTGVMSLAVQKNTAASVAADGDYHPLEVDANGRLHAILSASVGAGTAAAAQRTVAATDDPGVVLLTAIKQNMTASASFTPAASSHTGGSAGVIGDCVGAAQQFTFSPVPISGSNIAITNVSLLIASGTAVASAWRLYLYNVTPPSAIADDAAFDIPSGDRASLLGYVPISTTEDSGNSSWVQVNGLYIPIQLSGTTVFGYLVNLTTATLAAVAHTVTLTAEQH